MTPIAPSTVFGDRSRPSAIDRFTVPRRPGRTIQLTRGEAAETVLGPSCSNQLVDDARVDGRTTARDPVRGVRELARFAQPIFQEIADAAGPGAEQT